MMINRRHILAGTGAIAAVAGLGMPVVRAQAKPRVVVIGGG
ncbi:MAG: twin-arginine translocation signal domain-containing protein, partial [Rhabdaerophilum sp.]